MPRAGVERGQKTQGKLGVREKRDAQNDAVSIRNAGANNDLLTLPNDLLTSPADVQTQPRRDKAQPVCDLTRQASDAKPANNPADLLASSGSDTTEGKGGKVAKVLSALSALSATPKTLEKVRVLADNKADKTGKTLVSHVRRDDAKPALDVEALLAAIGALSPAERLRLLEALAGTGQAHAPRPVAAERP
jgi:hypothetical protein